MTEEELENALDFCGCGDPDSAREFVREGLQIIADQRKGPHYTRNAGRFDTEFVKWCEDHNARELKHFGSPGATFFFYYWTVNKDLTEHGGSVPGWLTEKGEAVLAALTAQLVDNGTG